MFLGHLLGDGLLSGRMFTFSSLAGDHPLEQEDGLEEDDQVSAGFYTDLYESIDDLRLRNDDEDNFRVINTDEFVDMKYLGSNHVLTAPGETGESFVQLAQDQFDAGDKLKFSDCVKSKQHFGLAALYFKRAADQMNYTAVLYTNCSLSYTLNFVHLILFT